MYNEVVVESTCSPRPNTAKSAYVSLGVPDYYIRIRLDSAYQTKRSSSSIYGTEYGMTVHFPCDIIHIENDEEIVIGYSEEIMYDGGTTTSNTVVTSFKPYVDVVSSSPDSSTSGAGFVPLYNGLSLYIKIRFNKLHYKFTTTSDVSSVDASFYKSISFTFRDRWHVDEDSFIYSYYSSPGAAFSIAPERITNSVSIETVSNQTKITVNGQYVSSGKVGSSYNESRILDASYSVYSSYFSYIAGVSSEKIFLAHKDEALDAGKYIELDYSVGSSSVTANLNDEYLILDNECIFDIKNEKLFPSEVRAPASEIMGLSGECIYGMTDSEVYVINVSNYTKSTFPIKNAKTQGILSWPSLNIQHGQFRDNTRIYPRSYRYIFFRYWLYDTLTNLFYPFGVFAFGKTDRNIWGNEYTINLITYPYSMLTSSSLTSFMDQRYIISTR